MVETNVILCVAAITIYAIQAGISLCRESRMNTHRDNLIKIFRNRETDLLNRLMAKDTPEFLHLNAQDAGIEESRAKVDDSPKDVVDDLLEQAGLGSDGFSKDGVSVV